MVRKVIIVCVALLFPFWCQGQASVEHHALHQKKKKKWERTYQQLKKTIGKDSTNVAVRYLLAGYFFSNDNPAYNIDSAYYYTTTALNDYQRTSLRERERMRRVPLDSNLLVHYRQKIDSAAFERACSLNTGQAYNDFLATFADAAQRDEAYALRDEAAFADAVKANTHQAFLHFLQKHPMASRAREAREKYEALLFEDRTSDQRLSSYKQFLKEYPQTPFRAAAERKILGISTASGSEESFIKFLEEYPQSACKGDAINILFYLISENAGPDAFPAHLRSDSLSRVVRMGQGYLIPYFKTGKFGFMDTKGEVVIEAKAEHIDDEYLCGGIREEIIVLPDKIVTRNGATIYNGTVTAVDDLGSGFLKTGTENCIMVLHRSGSIFPGGCIDDAKLVSGRFVALRKENLWSIWTLTGIMLQPYQWDDITAIEDVVLFHKNGKIALAPAAAVAGIADQQPLMMDVRYDDVKRWQHGYLWLKAGNEEMVYDAKLSPYVGPGDHRLSQTFFGVVSKSPDGFVLINEKGIASVPYRSVQIAYPWTAVKTDSTWHLLDPATQEKISATFDSVTVAGRFAAGLNRDSITIFSELKEILKLSSSVKFESVPGQDSSAYFSIYQGGKISLFNAQGQRLFTGPFDKVQHAGGKFHIVHKKEKKGLVTVEGKMILPVEYDAIGTVSKGGISLLRSTKFGLYDHTRNKLIKAAYQKNLAPFNNAVITAFKDGAYGFIGWDNKPLSAFEFDEIRYWNDTTALVKKKQLWGLYDLESQTMIFENIKTLKMIRDTPLEKLSIIQQGEHFGVIHSKKGIVIPLRFSDIVNVGTSDQPTYFTEKHVTEAGIFVVIYYDSNGKLIRHEVYEQDDYEKIYCSD